MAQFYRGYKVWTQDEINLLKEQINKGMDVEEIAKSHDRTVGAITSRIEILRNDDEYTQAEVDDIVERLKGGETLTSISKFYKRKPKGIINKLKQLKLGDMVPDMYKKVKSKKSLDDKPEIATWIPIECNLLINKIKQGTNIEQISKDLNKSIPNIYLKLVQIYYDILTSKNKEEPTLIVTAKEDMYVFKMSQFIVLVKHGLQIKLKDGTVIPLSECKINISQTPQFGEILSKMDDITNKYSTVITALRNIEYLSDIEFFIKHYSYLCTI